MAATSYRDRVAPLWAAALSVALITLVGYGPILDNFFTGTDSLTLIETSRIRNIGDVGRILTQPLMADSRFIEVAKFYRPISSLSYSLDTAIWHLDPFGFQLTNLLLHLATCLLVLFLMRKLAGGDTLFGWLAAALFAAHPILIESVPAIDRRHDVLATLFVAISLLLFLRSRQGKVHRRLLLAFSAAAYMVAVGAKETAIVVPFLVFGYTALYDSATYKDKERLKSGLRVSLPFLACTSCYLAWRVYLLGGLGGYVDSAPVGVAEVYTYLTNVVQAYAQDLLYPVDFLRLLGDDATYNLTPLVILYGAAYLLVYTRTTRGQTDRERRLPLFFGIWLAALLVLFLATMTFSHRTMYLSAVPFCGLVALPLVESFRWLRKKAKRQMGDEEIRIGHCRGSSQYVAVILGLVLVLSLTAYSPVLRSYGHWRDSARISQLFLERLCEGSDELSGTTAIHIYNLPDRVQSYLEKVPHAREVTYLQHYSIKSWLNLRYPHNRMTVMIHTRSWPVTFLGNLEVSIRFMGKEQVWALVQLDRRPLEVVSLHARRRAN